MKKANLFFGICLILCLSVQTWAQEEEKPTPSFTFTVVEEGEGEKPVKGQEVAFHSTVKDEEGNVVWDTKTLGFTAFEVIEDKEEPLEEEMMDQFLNMKKGGTYEIVAPKGVAGENAKDIKGETLTIVVTLEDFGEAKPDGVEKMVETMDEEGIAAATDWYEEKKEDNPEGYTFREGNLNKAGYQYLQKEKVDEAVALFQLNVERNPESHNAYDSLADGLIAKDDKDGAIQNLEKALSLKPDWEYVQKKLEALKNE